MEPDMGQTRTGRPELPDHVYIQDAATPGSQQPAIPVRHLPPLYPPLSNIGGESSDPPRLPIASTPSEPDVPFTYTATSTEPAGTQRPVNLEKQSTTESSEAKTPGHHSHRDDDMMEVDLSDIDGPKWWAPYANALFVFILAGICIYAVTMGAIYWSGRAAENERLSNLDKEHFELSSSYDIATTAYIPIETPEDIEILRVLSIRDAPDSAKEKYDGSQSCGTGQSCSSNGHPEFCCPQGLVCKTAGLNPSRVYCCSTLAGSDHQCVAADARVQTNCPDGMYRCEGEEVGGCCPSGTSCTYNRYVRVVDADGPGLERRPLPYGFVRPDASKRTLTARKFAEVVPSPPLSSETLSSSGHTVPGLLSVGSPVGSKTAPISPAGTLTTMPNPTRPLIPAVPPRPVTYLTSEIVTAITPVSDKPVSPELTSETGLQSTPESASIAFEASTFQSSTISRPDWHEAPSPTPNLTSSSPLIVLSNFVLVFGLLISIV